MGLNMLLKPITVFAEVVPFLSAFVDAVTGFVLGIIAFILTIITLLSLGLRIDRCLLFL